VYTCITKCVKFIRTLFIKIRDNYLTISIFSPHANSTALSSIERELLPTEV